MEDLNQQAQVQAAEKFKAPEETKAAATAQAGNVATIPEEEEEEEEVTYIISYP